MLGETSSSAENPQRKTAKEVLEQGSQFIKKKVVKSLLTLSAKDIMLNQKDAWFFKERYLGTQHYMVPEGKLRYYYEAILTEKNLVQIYDHYVDEGNFKTPITHSKCYIIRIIHPQE